MDAGLGDIAPKFTLFSRLPIELREKIWEEACNQPRVVDFWAFPVDGGIGNYRKLCQIFGEMPFAYKTHQKNPAVLEACQESRKVGNRHYELSFGTTFEANDNHFGSQPGVEITIKTPARIYVNWQVDIICLFPQNLSLLGDYFGEVNAAYDGPQGRNYRHKVRRIAIQVHEVQWAVHLLRSDCLEEIIFYIVPSRLRTLCYERERPITIEFGSLELDMDAKLREAGHALDAKKTLQEAKREVEEVAEKIKKANPEWKWKCPAINLMLMNASGY
jgi:hypothetical protein